MKIVEYSKTSGRIYHRPICEKSLLGGDVAVFVRKNSWDNQGTVRLWNSLNLLPHCEIESHGRTTEMMGDSAIGVERGGADVQSHVLVVQAHESCLRIPL